MLRRASALAGIPLLLLTLVACGDTPGSDLESQPDAGSRSDVAPERDEIPSVSSYEGEAMADHLERQLAILGDKMIQLARSVPEERFEWAPMDGVRSVGAVYAHVAADNFFVPALLGTPVEGTGVTATSGIAAYEAARGSKAEVVAELERSFEAMDAALADSRSRLGRTVMLRDTPITVGDLWVRAIVHLHEHLGQSIAYARTNQVVPPWSR